MKRIYFFIFCLPFLIVSCDTFGDPVEVPSYIYIDDIQVNPSASQGTASDAITDAWVFIDGEAVGVFPLPARVPILASGTVNLEIFGGIKENGIGASRDVYPFFNNYEITWSPTPGQVDTINPILTYNPSTLFKVIDGIEGSTILSVDLDGNAATSVSSTPTDIFEGARSGEITLTDADNVFEVASSASYILPNDGSAIYLELNYKCDIPFQIGLEHTRNFVPEKYYKLTLDTKEEWNKIYISFDNDTPVLQADSYRLIMRAAKDADGSTAKIFIDNIKILTFN